MRFSLTPDRRACHRLLGRLWNRPPAAPEPVRRGPVTLYGAGAMGQLALEFAGQVGLPLRCALDRVATPGQRLGELPVWTPAAVRPQGTILVTTVSAPYTAVAHSLHRLGWRDVRPFYDFAQAWAAGHPLDNGWFAGSLSAEDRAGMRFVLGALEDSWSRAAYLQHAAWRCLRADWVFGDAPVTPDNRFLIPEVLKVLRPDETVLDAGAYDGRFLRQFLGASGGRLGGAALIEPDASNRALCAADIARLPPELAQRVRLSPLALSDASGRLGFRHGFGMMSKLDPRGDATVEAARLDDLALAPSYVKLHLEGGELAALRGGLATLQRCRPIVAATVYHGRDGLWRTAAFLARNLDNYRLLFRLHSWCATGAVIYAIPHERPLSLDRRANVRI